MTTPLASKPLVEAIVVLLQAGVPSGCAVYWAGAPQGAAVPYAVIYPDSGTKSGFHRNLLNDGPDELRYQVTSVGASPGQAQLIADKVALTLLTTIPDVPGRRVWPTIEEGSQVVRREDESDALWIATAQYLSRSDST
ncbi:hypothetical protein ACFYY8_31615 [Streptosporangium sp. NPDC001559]|uniref:hypothetical protein n=1 Tax=Streptosporangium sp. NPDC001559 TaxID=3366187 RepID=UPI0036E6F081